jgi:hypothetical protein
MLGCVDLTGTIFRLGGARDKTFQGGAYDINHKCKRGEAAKWPPPLPAFKSLLNWLHFLYSVYPVCYEFSSSAAYLITDWIDPMEQSSTVVKLGI